MDDSGTISTVYTVFSLISLLQMSFLKLGFTPCKGEHAWTTGAMLHGVTRRRITKKLKHTRNLSVNSRLKAI